MTSQGQTTINNYVKQLSVCTAATWRMSLYYTEQS